LLQFLLALVVVRFLMRVVSPLMRRPAAAPKPRTTDLVFDSVCNTHVPRERALKATIGGREQYFCSPECRAKAALRLNTVS
jgi:hypothetical protein